MVENSNQPPLTSARDENEVRMRTRIENNESIIFKLARRELSHLKLILRSVCSFRRLIHGAIPPVLVVRGRVFLRFTASHDLRTAIPLYSRSLRVSGVSPSKNRRVIREMTRADLLIGIGRIFLLAILRH